MQKKEKEELNELEKKILSDFEKNKFIAAFEITNGHNGYGNSNLIYKKQQINNNEYFITKKLSINKNYFYNAVVFVATNPETVNDFCELLKRDKNKRVLFAKSYDQEIFYKTLTSIIKDSTLDSERKGFFNFLLSNKNEKNLGEIIEYFNKSNFEELEKLIFEYEKIHNSYKSNNKIIKSCPGKSGFIRGALAENYIFQLFDYAFKENNISDYSMFKRFKSSINFCKRNRIKEIFKDSTSIELDLIIISKREYFKKVLNYLTEKELIFKKY